MNALQPVDVGTLESADRQPRDGMATKMQKSGTAIETREAHQIASVSEIWEKEEKQGAECL